jgi:RNA polymerase primary sigma factor
MSNASASSAVPELNPDSFGQYLEEIGRVELLTADQEVDLARRIDAGREAERILHEDEGQLDAKRRAVLRRLARQGHDAHDRMVETNLRLVVSVAKRYRTRGITLADLVQEGNLGLLRAVDKFDPAKGYRFSTYATWWIRQTIGRGLTSQSRTIRIPSHLVELLGKARRAERDLLQTLGRDPTTEEVADAVGVEVERLLELQRQAQNPSSLDAPVGEDAGASLGDLLRDENADQPVDVASASLLADDLRVALEGLSDRESAILRNRFGLDGTAPRTLESIAGDLGLTRERVRQLEVRALAKLRAGRGGESEHLLGYLHG